VKAAADTMRPNPQLDVASAITELAVGEALLSLLDEKGRPSVTQRAFVLPPGSQIGPITPAQRQALMNGSLVAGVYEKTVDRESAYEKLKGRAEASSEAAAVPTAPAPSASPGATPPPSPAGTRLPGAPSGGWLSDVAGGLLRGSGRKDSVIETVAKSAARSIGSAVGREIIRGVMGSLFGGGGSRRR
jgi:DNA helicase HerA-like ATPase